jgi:hypothetical protein
VPTKLALVGQGWSGSIARHFPGNDSERGAYLGAPVLAVVVLYAWRGLRRAGGRFLLAAFVLAVVASLGPTLTIDGHRSWPLPWEHVGYLPLFDNALPIRLSLYTALAAAVAVALWTSRAHGVLRWTLPALCVAAILPYPASPILVTSFRLPRFFTDSAYRTCLAHGENILPIPVTFDGNADLWQVRRGFQFTMAGGYVFSGPPDAFLHPPAVDAIAHGNIGDTRMVRVYIEEKRITSIVVDDAVASRWSRVLAPIATPTRIGGVLLYRVDGRPQGCAVASSSLQRPRRPSRTAVTNMPSRSRTAGRPGGL